MYKRQIYENMAEPRHSERISFTVGGEEAVTPSGHASHTAGELSFLMGCGEKASFPHCVDPLSLIQYLIFFNTVPYRQFPFTL